MKLQLKLYMSNSATDEWHSFTSNSALFKRKFTISTKSNNLQHVYDNYRRLRL